MNILYPALLAIYVAAAFAVPPKFNLVGGLEAIYPDEAVAWESVHDVPEDMTFRDYGVYIIFCRATGLDNVSSTYFDQDDAEIFVDVLNKSFYEVNDIPIRFFPYKRVSGGSSFVLLDLDNYPSGLEFFADDYHPKNILRAFGHPGAVNILHGISHSGFRGIGLPDGTSIDAIGSTYADYVIPHEVGHHLGMHHTFGMDEVQHPDGSNGAFVNDHLPDTEESVDIYMPGAFAVNRYQLNAMNVVWEPAMWSGQSSYRYIGLMPQWNDSDLSLTSRFSTWLTENPTYDMTDFYPYGLLDIMSYSTDYSWRFTSQQRADVELTTNAQEAGSYFSLRSPLSIQVYDNVEMADITVTATDPEAIEWDRVTTDENGHLGFPDDYGVYSSTSPTGPWTLRTTVTAETSPGVFPTTLSYVSAVNDDYWQVRPQDTEAGWAYEAIGADSDWKTYTGEVIPESAHLRGYIWRDDCVLHFDGVNDFAYSDLLDMENSMAAEAYTVILDFIPTVPSGAYTILAAGYKDYPFKVYCGTSGEVRIDVRTSGGVYTWETSAGGHLVTDERAQLMFCFDAADGDFWVYLRNFSGDYSLDDIESSGSWSPVPPPGLETVSFSPYSRFTIGAATDNPLAALVPAEVSFYSAQFLGKEMTWQVAETALAGRGNSGGAWTENKDIVWPIYEGYGRVLNDLPRRWTSGTADAGGTIVGARWENEFIGKQGIYLDDSGTADYIDFGTDMSDLDANAYAQITIEFEIKLNSAPASTVELVGSGYYGQQWAVRTNSNRYVGCRSTDLYNGYPGSQISGDNDFTINSNNSVLTVGTWHTVRITIDYTDRDGSGNVAGIVYVDGVDETLSTITGSDVQAEATVRMNSATLRTWKTGSYMGLGDDPTEMSIRNFRLASGIYTPAQTVPWEVWYPCDEGSGATVTDHYTNTAGTITNADDVRWNWLNGYEPR